jgi:hypothetical protein
VKSAIKWLNDALAAKDIGGMKYYRVSDREIRATDGRITAGHPWPTNDAFLVPGEEFEKVMARMPDKGVSIQPGENNITVKAGRFRGTITTLPVTEWNYPGIDAGQWGPPPVKLNPILRALRPFISDNATQPWALCVALEGDWAYATNNVAIAGAPCPAGGVKALLPCWAIDFIVSRWAGLESWCWTDHYVAFRWLNGAWMRAQLVVGSFPDRAAALVQQALNEEPTQVVSDEFRAAFEEVAGLAEDTILVYADRLESGFGKARVVSEIPSEVPADAEASVWGAKYLIPALQSATHWSPGMWPRPAVFRGPVVSGWVVGRRQ